VCQNKKGLPRAAAAIADEASNIVSDGLTAVPQNV
jgi:hypothetical protein